MKLHPALSTISRSELPLTAPLFGHFPQPNLVIQTPTHLESLNLTTLTTESATPLYEILPNPLLAQAVMKAGSFWEDMPDLIITLDN